MVQQGGLGGAGAESDRYGGPKMGKGGEAGGRRGGLGVWFETKGEDSTKATETDFMITAFLPQPSAPPWEGALRPHISKLLYTTTTDTLRDITQDKKGFPIRHGLIRKHGKIRMLTTHRDAHIYLFPYWVLDMIKRNETFDSVSEDVVGWWAKASWQDGLADKLSLREVLDPNHTSDDKDGDSGSYGSANIEDEVDLASMSSTHASTLCPNHPTITSTVISTPTQPLTIPPFLSYVHPTHAPLIRRVDNSHLLLRTSLYLATLPSFTDPLPGTTPSPLSHAQKIATSATLISPHTNIHIPTTLIAPNTTIATHAVIKNSVIGSNCIIGAGARLTGSLLMDGVVIGEKSVLQGCILGRRCGIGNGAYLRECEVQEGYQVGEGAEGKGEKYMVFEGLEEEMKDGETDEEAGMM